MLTDVRDLAEFMRRAARNATSAIRHPLQALAGRGIDPGSGMRGNVPDPHLTDFILLYVLLYGAFGAASPFLPA